MEGTIFIKIGFMLAFLLLLILLWKNLRKIKCLNKKINHLKSRQGTSSGADLGMINSKDDKLLYNFEQNNDKMQLVLDSVAEGIFGIDRNGICTFCNKSGLKLLGYSNAEQLLGKNMHKLIHHSHRDSSTLAPEECKIMNTFKTGEGVHVDDEVFWRADGTCFDVEYFSYPEYQDGKITGLVVTFLDITKRKEAERKMLYNSYHDALTGLYNRKYLIDNIEKIDTESNLPLSVIMGDVNGLKQTNDIFGHAVGDKLIKESANAVQDNCPSNGIPIRSGGDEFLVILPKTTIEEAKDIMLRMQDQMSKVTIQGAIRGSISFGISTKVSKEENIFITIENADANMYSQKALIHRELNDKAIDIIMKRLHELHPGEREHYIIVRDLCKKLGKIMNLSDSEMRRLADSAYYHDIGKISIDPKILNKKDSYSDHEIQLIRRHPIVGFRILNMSDKTLDIAKYVLSHHERWDGKGYPSRLTGKEIPKISRILAIVNNYEKIIRGIDPNKAETKEEAIKEIRKYAGGKFDPEIVEIFTEMMKGTD